MCSNYCICVHWQPARWQTVRDNWCDVTPVLAILGQLIYSFKNLFLDFSFIIYPGVEPAWEDLMCVSSNGIWLPQA